MVRLCSESSRPYSGSRVLKLYSKLERHIKVRGDANPYDPRYTEYFEQRRCFAWRVLGGGPNASVVSASSE
jgi:hypothetical protein